MYLEEIPSGWKIAKMGDVCELRKETINPSNFPDMPYVGLEHIDSGDPRLKKIGTSSEVNSSKSRFYSGDILYGKLRPYLDKSVLVDFDGLCSTDILVLKSKESIVPQFVVNTIHTSQFLSYSISTSSGVNHPRTSWSSISAFQFLLPPLPEQRAIARALRAVQAARETRLREIALERERKAALMEHLFTHGTRGEPTKMTEIGEMPEGWKTPKLADLAEIQSGGTPLRNHHEYYNGSINWAKTLDLNDGIVRSTEEKITDLGFHSIRGKIRPIDTVMVAMYGGSGTVGKSGILGIPAATNQAVCCIEPNFERFDSLYLLYYLIHFRPNWMRYAIGTRKDPNISKGIIESLKIPLPPLGQQKEISRTIKACDTKITALGQEACLLDELFRAMLEELMTGRQRAGALVSDKS